MTDEQLNNANEPTFSTALNSKNEAKKDTETAPQQFRQQEQQTLSSGQQEAQTSSQTGLQEMHGQNEAVMNQVVTQQQQTGTQDTTERTRIATSINELYQTTKTEVEAILKTLDETVARMFSNAAAKAKKMFIPTIIFPSLLPSK